MSQALSAIIYPVNYVLNSHVRYQDKSSNLAIDEYSEAAVFIGLVWGRGSVPRTGIL